jgi:hypothetical protein
MLCAVRVVLSADMEGMSQLRQASEIVAACPEYWLTGKPRYEDEVAAACDGLLAGGATEVVVLDNHASGNPANIAVDALPSGTRLETWNLWDVPRHPVDRCSRSATTLAAVWTDSSPIPTGSGFVCAVATSSSPRATDVHGPPGHA